MNTPKPSKTPYIIIAIIVVFAIIAYFYWSGSQPPADLTLGITNGGEQVVGARVFQLLGEIKSIKVDTAFFKDKSYQTLRDYSVAIPSLPIGRPNPFAPLPGVSTPGAGTSGGASGTR